MLSAGAGFVESMPGAKVVDAVGLEEVDEAEGDLKTLPVKPVALLITHCESFSQE